MTPLVVGHRGWPARFPGNTLAGFLAAAGVADVLEMDIRRSADGKLVLSHDPSIVGLEVAAHLWIELGETDLGHGHRPSLLDEVRSSLPDVAMQLEVKNMPHEPGFEPDHRIALETAERAGPGDMVTSFNWASLSAVRRLFPEVATGVLVVGSVGIDQAIDECLAHGHRALVPSVQSPIVGLIRALELGLSVFPWVVNDEDRAGELAGLGVSGIITDDPPLVRAVIEGKQ
ncbi:MAG TPA: glycerophosphodiester phosphodiesterase [Acidimicrobiia bacterium]